MSRQRYVKVECDQCGKTEYLIYAAVSGQLKQLGWYTETDGRDLCSSKCLADYKATPGTEPVKREPVVPIGEANLENCSRCGLLTGCPDKYGECETCQQSIDEMNR